MIINSGFKRKRESNDRLPPGQYETQDFPVLSLGPTPIVKKETWQLEVSGLAKKIILNWDQLNKLPIEDITTDIHCVTKWSKFDTKWQGISFDYLLDFLEVSPTAKFLIAHSSDGYTTNIPIEDLKNHQAWIAVSYDNQDIEPKHGGPVRLLIPHLYFWKSAKWLSGLEFVDQDNPGFWEVRGYHNYGDPWKEQRYDFDK